MSLREVLALLANGQISIAEAESMIRLLAIEKVGEKIKLDLGREYRIGIPEIILAEYKDLTTLKRE